METLDRAGLAAQVAAGAVLFDLRPAPLPVFGLTPRHLDVAALQRGELPDLPRETPIVLVCWRGQVSELAGLYLEAAGFASIYHLAGGVRAFPA